jgi:catechol 2,3-dioxygenase
MPAILRGKPADRGSLRSLRMSDPPPRLGHVHLRVADLERATAFYRDGLGFAVTGGGPDAGIPMAFLALGDYHHHLGLNVFESAGGTPPPAGHTGLYHLALVYEDAEGLAQAVRRVLDHGYPVDSARDHGGTVSVYLRDPDGNGIELYYDRPRERWTDAAGRLVLANEPLDIDTILNASAG